MVLAFHTWALHRLISLVRVAEVYAVTPHMSKKVDIPQYGHLRHFGTLKSTACVSTATENPVTS